MNRIFRAEDFIQYNGFYGSPDYRQVVLQLYGKKCASCQGNIDDGKFDVAHIIPRSHPGLMQEYYPCLDVDNLLNLKLSCVRCNRKESNFIVAGIPLQRAFNESARVISTRLQSALGSRQATATRIAIGADDPLICSGLLFLDAEEIRTMTAQWDGSVVFPAAELCGRIGQALQDACGATPDSMTICAAKKETIGAFPDYLELDGKRYSSRNTTMRPWLIKALQHLDHTDSGLQPDAETTRPAGLIDGIYLDAAELALRKGLVVLLRTASQRWLRDLFASILRIRRKLDQCSDKRYVVLDEHEWRSLCLCHDKLGIIENGIGKTGRRLGRPEVATLFRRHGNKLWFGTELPDISGAVKRLCRCVATESIWGDSALLLRSRLKSWLEPAFLLATQAAQQTLGPHLVRIEDGGMYQWVPPLPRLVAKTGEECLQEDSPLLGMTV